MMLHYLYIDNSTYMMFQPNIKSQLSGHFIPMCSPKSMATCDKCM